MREGWIAWRACWRSTPRCTARSTRAPIVLGRPALASPLLGSGIALGAVEQCALAGVLPEAEAVRAKEEDMQKLEERLMRLEARRPYLQHLGMVPTGSADEEAPLWGPAASQTRGSPS